MYWMFLKKVLGVRGYTVHTLLNKVLGVRDYIVHVLNKVRGSNIYYRPSENKRTSYYFNKCILFILQLLITLVL